jgi:hypothetical protein
MTMHMRSRRLVGAAAAFVSLSIVIAGCSSDDEGSDSEKTETDGGSQGSGELEAIRVPQDFETIQEAVNEAEAGDLVLVDEGVYNEAVDVTTADITIRGVDRNKVILDGEFELENGIRVLDTDGVQVENMTARNYTSNGFFWTGSDRYRGSYLTAYRNGDYGIYAFDAYHGQFDNSYGGGSPDAGFYIGECYECDAVIDTVISENNGLGYSGTNSGGELYIVNSIFRNNRAGIVPNSGSYELCYPGRENVIVGNVVYDNNNQEGPAIDVALLAQGNGILLAGSIDNVVERNLVYDHDRTGIAAVPFPEEDASDIVPPVEQNELPCEETRDDELPDPESIPDVVLWNASGNRFVGNVVSGSGLADLASGTIALDADSPTTADLENCFSDNEHDTTAPTDLEALAPCDGEGSGGDFEAGALDLLVLINEMPPAPPKDAYKTTPEPGDQPNMPDALTKAPTKFEAPEKPDVDAIEVPSKPTE